MDVQFLSLPGRRAVSCRPLCSDYAGLRPCRNQAAPLRSQGACWEASNWALAAIWALAGRGGRERLWGEHHGGGGLLGIKPGSAQPAVEFLV
jgi:hypothetical protein